MRLKNRSGYEYVSPHSSKLMQFCSVTMMSAHSGTQNLKACHDIDITVGGTTSISSVIYHLSSVTISSIIYHDIINLIVRIDELQLLIVIDRQWNGWRSLPRSSEQAHTCSSTDLDTEIYLCLSSLYLGHQSGMSRPRSDTCNRRRFQLREHE